jgi:hypothetical protein
LQQSDEAFIIVGCPMGSLTVKSKRLLQLK